MVIDKEYYEMIFKRKSFRKFDDSLRLSDDELCDINEKIKALAALIYDIDVKYRIVKREETTCKRGECCLLIYSEEKEEFLLNIGYMFEQLDLYLASKDIGVCWYGMGKTQESEYENLKFVIMMAIGKGQPNEFRRDYTKCKRKETKEIWNRVSGFDAIAEVVKYAPSSCNTQPWRVICEKDKLKIYRTIKVKSIMPKDKVPFYNSIDMGIFLCFLELALLHNHIPFQRILCEEEDEAELIPVAIYNLERRANMFIQEKECGNKIEGIKCRERIGAYALILDSDNKIALVKRDNNYFLPGGGVEKDETYEECLKRECSEEIGYNLEIGEYIGKLINYTKAVKRDEYLKLVGHFYIGKLLDMNNLKIEEDHELIWVTIKEAAEKMQEEFHVHAIREYIRQL